MTTLQARGTWKVNADLTTEARERIRTAIEVNGGKIKAVFVVKIGSKSTNMRIDMVTPIIRGGKHGGARVPHAQLEQFFEWREIQRRPSLGGASARQKKLVPFTSKFPAVELDSGMVIETIEKRGKRANIEVGSRLYSAIEKMISYTARGKKWEKLLFPPGTSRKPVIMFTDFEFSTGRNPVPEKMIPK